MIDVRFMVPRRSLITLSGDGRAFPPSLLRRISIPLALVVLAFVPLALATWSFGRAFRSSEADRVDARLAAAIRIAADRSAAESAAALEAARALAATPALQRALARGEPGALRRFERRDGALSLVVRRGRIPAPPADAIVREVSVRGPAGPLGTVTAELRPAPLLRAVAGQTGVDAAVSAGGVVEEGPLRGWHVSGPGGKGFDLRYRGGRYRVLQQRVAPGLAFVVAVPHSVIDGTVRSRQLLTLGAGILTIAALALAALVVLPRRRPTARHDPLALVGQAVAAAHDPHALLPVILETTVASTGAAGGRLLLDGEVVATLGAPAGIAEPLVLPLDDEEGSGSRVLVLYPPRGGFTASERELARSLAAQSRIALENAVLHSVVRRQAVTDELTDLANRRRFMEALQQDVARSDRFGTPLALVLFDLDHFKEINDRCGHQTGDDVLRSASAVIRSRVRETDLAARIGGEEFGVIVPGTDVDGAAALAEHLRRDLAEQVRVKGLVAPVTASFGVAAHQVGEPAEALIGSADRELYRAKAEGRNRVCVAALGGEGH
jgi:diguanylate cyclase (GGDEF)-like protein